MQDCYAQRPGASRAPAGPRENPPGFPEAGAPLVL
jgi:hypothetical protein